MPEDGVGVGGVERVEAREKETTLAENPVCQHPPTQLDVWQGISLPCFLWQCESTVAIRTDRRCMDPLRPQRTYNTPYALLSAVVARY